jgi:hypothetical protein
MSIVLLFFEGVENTKMVRSPWHPQQFQCLETHLRQSKDVKGELATVVYNFWYDEECHFQCSFYCVLYSIEFHEFTVCIFVFNKPTISDTQ